MKNMKDWTETDDLRLTRILEHLTGWCCDTDEFKDFKQDFYITLLTRKQDRLTDVNFWSCIYCKAHNFLKDYFEKNHNRDKHIKFISYYATGDYFYEDHIGNNFTTANDEGACPEVIKKIVDDFTHASNPHLMEKCDMLIDRLISFDEQHRPHKNDVGIKTGLFDLLMSLAEGYTQRQIADLWGVSEKTVSILRKKLQKIAEEIGLKG